jgi:hypothetical protein
MFENNRSVLEASLLISGRRSEWRKLNGFANKEEGKDLLAPDGNEEQKVEEITLDEDEGKKLLNKENLSEMIIKILVVGLEGSFQKQILERYGAKLSKKQNQEGFTIHSITLEDETYFIKVKFYLPNNNDLKVFVPTYEKLMKDKFFDAVMMICLHNDAQGQVLK